MIVTCDDTFAISISIWVQAFEEPISEIGEGGSSNCLSALDVPEKKLQWQNSAEISDTVC